MGILEGIFLYLILSVCVAALGVHALMHGNLKREAKIIALSIALLLTACGGGGGGSTPTPTPTPTPSTAGEWTWVSGISTAPVTPVYGTQGFASVNNYPGGLQGAVSWIDSSGNFWVFGGTGYTVLSTPYATYNDLWEFNSISKEWTWVSGSNDDAYAAGIYGTLGVASVNNTPGGRSYAVSWIDSGGNLWLFGGDGIAGDVGYLNDLWKFNPAAKTWTWVSGSNSVPLVGGGQSGVYGTLGTPAVGNTPGGRSYAVSGVDSTGNLWLFGGDGYGSTNSGQPGFLNDLWEFNPTTKEWTWTSGSSTANANGVYGTLGVVAASNVPGGRRGAVGGIDSSGDLWLFGGLGLSGTGYLNDLWKFNPTSKQWTWVSGNSMANATGVYGTQGTASASNVPGGRTTAVSWIDSSGNYWLFGGDGYDAFGNLGVLNDLWEFKQSSKEWTWVSGSNLINALGIYGTQGVASSSDVPGAREDSVSGIDSSGNLWLFGGGGHDSVGYAGELNDLWRYQP
ncbi:MAG: kelch repeat-containing protein [Terracidiphilus sp.]